MTRAFPYPRGRGAFRLTPPAFALAALLCIAATPGAPPPDALADPGQEAHAHALFRQVRCLVCQNESIDDSEAPLAGDLRHLVRQQVAGGRSDAEIRAFLVRRYGEFVLLKPALSPANALLWLTPFVIVGAGGVALAMRGASRPGRIGEAPLDAAEEARLGALAAADGRDV